MQPLIEGLKALGPVRLAAMGVVGVAVLGLLALLSFGSTSQPWAPLYAGLDLADAGQAADQLSRQHIPYQLGAGGTAILVPADQVPQARVLLAKAGLPAGGTVGYEIFDRTDGFGVTEFQQQINATRALEGELARTIRALDGVRGVRVHLVMPRREPFAREPQEAQASVLLTMAGAARLDREGVQAVLNLVSAAVPSLKSRNVAIVDSRGDVLARAGTPVGAADGAMSADEVRRATELRLARAVEEMLERSLGPGSVRAEAAVRMNFDQLRETSETFDPDGKVSRSEQSVTTNRKSNEPGTSVSVQNNLPNADSAQSGAASEESKREETTNYEIGKTVRTLIREQPEIARISLAVMVDAAKARKPDELARIDGLVKTAIGFDAKRGDQVRVEAMPFVDQNAPPAEAARGLLGGALDKLDLMRLAQLALFGAIGVVAVLMVLRPMVLRLTSLPGTAEAALTGSGSLDALAAAPGIGPGLATLPGGLAVPAASTLPMPGVPLLEDESMVSIAQVEGQMRASSIRRISDLADKHPEETLAVMRGWMAQEAN